MDAVDNVSNTVGVVLVIVFVEFVLLPGNTISFCVDVEETLGNVGKIGVQVVVTSSIFSVVEVVTKTFAVDDVSDEVIVVTSCVFFSQPALSG